MKKKLKARRMWANYYPSKAFSIHRTRDLAAHIANRSATDVAVPVAVIPLDDINALRKKLDGAYDGGRRHLHPHDITAMLVAIGVLPKARKNAGGLPPEGRRAP